jgi:hypothetical protein
MKRYVARFVSFMLVFSAGPVFAGFIDTLKGLIPGHHEQPVKQRARSKAKSRSNPNKGDKPGESPSPNAEASPGTEASPAPSPVPVPSAEPTVDDNQAAAADQSPKPVSTAVTLQSSTATAPSVAIDPPPLY